MTLQEAMVEILRRHGGGWLSRDVIAREIAADELYLRPSDGQPAPSDQLRLRARKYRHLFECSDTACTRIRLRAGAKPSSSGRAAVPPHKTQRRRGSGRATGRGRASRPKQTQSTSRDAEGARRRRERAARKYRPDRVKLLLVAEAPPAALDRYFYFEDVTEHDSLFRYIVRAILKTEPERADKPALLAQLCDRGVFLIDLKPDPVDGSPLVDEVQGLIRRIRRLAPAKIVLIKATVYDAAFWSLRDEGLPVVDERVPFPGSGQQKRFLEAFERAMGERRRRGVT